ncbi:MAG: DUF4382 domain-containing protein [Gammaproteobacteria bacterium]|nr:DUF4382 domain-containing protein [Gammaproteobacteria bacterium]MDE2346404.1 DUF4382 domain-containing protein [Gammaproteobacteria bacterium]
MNICVRILRHGLLAVAVCISLGLAACGGGGSSGSSSSLTTNCANPTPLDPNGCVYLGMTDAPGDFLTYTVNISSMTLKRADGATVQMLPQSTTVDFAQYSNLTEFLTGVSMPPGNYVSGTITLDYSNADIQVEDNNGNPVQVTPLDQNGNPITGQLTLTIDLDTGTGILHVAPGIPRLLDVDFNLQASNQVDLNNDTVTVQPFLDAVVNPDINNMIRLRGPLASVDTQGSSYTIGIAPFWTRANSSNPYGRMTIHTTGSTVFEINQQGYTGSAGLAALAAAGPTTATLAMGSFDFTTNQYVATEVDAGSSVPGGTMDAAQGVVTAVNGSTLTLQGATLIRSSQTVTFADSVAVTVGPNTRVHEEGQPNGSFSTSDISVGQRLTVFGTITNPNPGSLAMDASNGFVGMEYTRVDATFMGPDGSGTGMLVNVQSIEDRPISMFNFTGTGSDPASYDVDLNGLSDSGFGVNDPVASYGFVTPFGSAPPDFSATSVTDFANASALVRLNWASPGSTQAFSSIDATNGIVPNLSSSPTADVLRRGGIVVSLTSLPASPVILGNGYGAYAILQNGVVQVHVTFSGFVTDLSNRLTAGASVTGFYAIGGFDSSSNTLTSNKIAVVVH